MSDATRRAGQIRSVGLHLLAGVLFGFVAQVADGFAPWSSAITSHGGVWLAVLIVVGLAAPSPGAAAVRAMALFVGVLAGYYASSAADYGSAPRLSLVGFWALLGLAVAPGLAALAHQIRGRGLRAAILGALFAGAFLAEAAFVAFRNPSDRRWPVVWLDIVAAMFLLASTVARTRRSPTVLGVTAIATVLGAGALVLSTEIYSLV